MKKCILILLLTVVMINTYSQTLMNKDSLLRLLPTARQDTNLVLLFINIGQQFEINSDYETAKAYYLKAKKLSEELGYRKGIIKFASNYTYILNVQKKTDSSLLINRNALRVALSINEPVLIAKSYINVGSSFFHADMYDSAIVYYETGKAYLENSGEKELLADIDDIMQATYRELHQYDRAIRAGEGALQFYRSANDSVKLGIVISNLGTNYVSTGELRKGLALFNEALVIARKINYTELEQSLMLNIGNVYLQNQVTDSLVVYFGEALRLSKKLDLPEHQSVSYRGLAIHALYKRNFPLAKTYMDSALVITAKFNIRKEHVKNLESLSSILYAMNEIEQAEQALQLSSNLRDSLMGDDLRKQVLISEKRFETRKKEDQIKLQLSTIHQKNILNYIFSGGTLALLIIVALGYRTYSQKHKLQQQRIGELETEKQLAATEAVLQGEEQERTRLAKDLHDGLGGMLSGIKYSFQTMKGNLIMTLENQEAFERGLDMLDSSILEMRRVAHNMMPETLVKFGLDVALRDFCNEINRSGILKVIYQSNGLSGLSIDQTTAIAVYRIVQELVNNTIKHADATSTIVQAGNIGGTFILTVEDNGKGFDPRILDQSKGIGWSNIQNRVEFLKGKLDVRSSSDMGTSVLIELTL